jgi:hypothetical protein
LAFGVCFDCWNWCDHRVAAATIAATSWHKVTGQFSRNTTKPTLLLYLNTHQKMGFKTILGKVISLW